MPKNIHGGSGHRSQRAAESSKVKNNRCLVDALLDDIAGGEILTDVYVARVMKRMGEGRMQVFFMNRNNQGTEMIVPIRGGMRRSLWVNADNLVLVVETGLARMTHEIVAVFSDAHVARYKKVAPTADPRLFVKGNANGTVTEEGFEFVAEAEEDVDVDTI